MCSSLFGPCLVSPTYEVEPRVCTARAPGRRCSRSCGLKVVHDAHLLCGIHVLCMCTGERGYGRLSSGTSCWQRPRMAQAPCCYEPLLPPEGERGTPWLSVLPPLASPSPIRDSRRRPSTRAQSCIFFVLERVDLAGLAKCGDPTSGLFLAAPLDDLTSSSMMEYRNTPIMATVAPTFSSNLSGLPRAMAMPTMTMARLAVLATEAVTAPVALIVIVASSLYK
mmetsp:Transcript_23283/g.75418  ORF Transcript_23283/g.75418 Transcript_23283/m.75418 type:complete len:223 (-) Transcript_23283:882-1550(-)